MAYKKTITNRVYEVRGVMHFEISVDSKLWDEFKEGKYFFDFNSGDFLSEDVEIIGDYFVRAGDINEEDRSEVISYEQMTIYSEDELKSGRIKVHLDEEY